MDEALELFSLSGEEILIVMADGEYIGALSRRSLFNAKRYGLKVNLSEIAEEIPSGETFPGLEVLRNPLGAFLVLKETPKSLITLKEGPLLQEGLFKKETVKLKGELKTFAQILCEISSELGVSAYFVGGVVRDLILNRPCFDIDVVITRKVQKFAEKFARALQGEIIKKSLFGTFKIKAGAYIFDIAQMRWEYYEAPARLPRIAPGPLRLDLFRRDFTVNALALCPVTGQIVDFYGGVADIFSQKLRVLHVLSFIDDPTRIFRAARYATRFNLELTKTTLRAIDLALKFETLNLLTPARLRNEFLRIFEEKEPLKAILFLKKHRILKKLFSLDPDETLFKKAFHLAEVAGLGERAEIELVALLLAGSPEEFAKLELSTKKFESYQRQRKSLEEKASWLLDPAIPVSEKVFFLEKFPKELLCASVSFLDEDFLLRCFKHYFKVSPGLSGKDLKRLGLNSGPILGKILKKIRAAKLDGQIKDGEEITFLEKELKNGFPS
ncbi:CCA tRNA nucleotidyltransferase [Thermodesulfatator autotrophicus]|nr:CCA tRNA nucleotidyltransferase [Thermodesulfatator autotrophicus]